VTAKTAKRLANFERLATDLKLSKDLTEEGRSLLERMPKLEAKQSLRKAYQKLADGTTKLAAFTKERTDILDSTKMTDAEAFKVAGTVLEAGDIVRESYFKDVNLGQLTEWGIRGLYKRLDEATPPSIEKRLDNAKNLQLADLNKLLMEARRH